jgi:ribonucleoside-diphosphate reductase alpha chain
LGDYRIIRRNGAVVAFEPSKIAIAMTKAFLAVNGGQGAASARIRELVEQLTDGVVARWCVASRAAAPSISKTCRTRWNWR